MPETSKADTFGFLFYQKRTVGTDLHVQAALLAIDRHGHPLEFRYTDTVSVNALQQLLYGAQFVTGFLGKVMFEPLVRAVESRPQVWLVQQTDLLGLRPHVGQAMLEVSPGSVGDWPKYGSHTDHPEDLDYVADLYEAVGRWNCLEIFARVESVLLQMGEENVVEMLPPVLQKPEAEAEVELEVVAEVPTEAAPEPVFAPPVEEAQRLDSFEEQPGRPPAAAEDTLQGQFERLLVHLVETDQLQATHFGYQVAGSLMWVHRAHFFNVAEENEKAVPLTVQIDRDLLRRSVSTGLVEAYEVYKELYGKMAVVFKLDLRKYPRLSQSVGSKTLVGS